MNQKERVSVVIVTYRRLQRLESILRAWLDQTPDVWLCDCSYEGFLHGDLRREGVLPIKYIRAFPDPGNRIRHAIATITQGDFVIKADDDILPMPGLIDDFREYAAEFKDSILGIHGRLFSGPDYYKDTIMITGKGIKRPQAVDFLGVLTFSPRQFLPMDLRGCETPIEDLWWGNIMYPGVPKIVIPSNKYESMSESKDPERLCANKNAREMRQKFYLDYCYES